LSIRHALLRSIKLRYLQTMTQVAGDRASTVILPLPLPLPLPMDMLSSMLAPDKPGK